MGNAAAAMLSFTLMAAAPPPSAPPIAQIRSALEGVTRLRRALSVMEKASQGLINEGAPDLFEALWRMEGALRDRRFVDRLRDEAAANDRA